MSPVPNDITTHVGDDNNSIIKNTNAPSDPSPAYSPMDFYVDSSSTTPMGSRPCSPVTFTTFETSLIQKIKSRIESKDKFFSLEFFPPRTKSGAINLMSRLERMGCGHPLFIDITWHAAGNPTGDSETSSTMIAHSALNYVGLETMLHMTCLGCTKKDVHSYLERCKNLGIRNILALRGDQAANLHKNDDDDVEEKLKFGSDLVREIRSEWGPDDFTICVAGYPRGHPEADSYEEDLLRLKDKVDAGADFIITQLFFKACTFKKFVDDCRAVGIECPILPGVMPIQSYDSLRHIVKLSKLDIPDEIQRVVQPLKGNNDAIRNYGVHHVVEMMRDLFTSGYAQGVHIYTLNREVSATSILKKLGLWKSDPSSRILPFKLAADPKRSNEEVRPIFWNKRSKTYVYRTRHWDEFPNGRWGNSASPAFGELKDYYLFYLTSQSPKEELTEMWGNLTCEEDVWDVFTRYLTGEGEKKVTKIIFNEDCLDPETELIADKLALVNKKGILTVNSQPSVNCAPSTDARVGWGPAGGYVFQKAYLEFFTSEENVIALLQVLGRYPTVNFQVLNHDASFNCTNIEKLRPIAVTWGVFPGCEIKQPTIVDPVSFRAWSEEAFALWHKQWANLYEPESQSRKVVEQIANTYYLVNLVDNDFPKGNCIWNVLDDMFARKKLNAVLEHKPTLESVMLITTNVNLLSSVAKDH